MPPPMLKSAYKQIVKKEKTVVTLDAILENARLRADEIKKVLGEFALIRQEASNQRFWEELVFCIFTAGASARMGLNSVDAVRDLIADADQETLFRALHGKHRYPFARAGYIVATRDFLKGDCQMQIVQRLESFSDDIARRDWLAKERGIKGLGYKEASHYLRNIGFRGYAILDKHILRSLYEIGVLDSFEPPSNRRKYLAIEVRMREFADEIGIDFDELDLVLWSMKTGEILK